MFHSETQAEKAETLATKKKEEWLPGRLDNAQICEQMVYYLTPTSFTWFTVEFREAGVWAHTAICWERRQKEDDPVSPPNRRAKTPQHGSRKCLWRPHMQIHQNPDRTEPKRQKTPTMQSCVCLTVTLKRQREVCGGCGLDGVFWTG